MSTAVVDHSTSGRTWGETQIGPVETFRYDDAISRAFMGMTIVWALVAMLVGIYVALELVVPQLNWGLQLLSFGRLRPLHTNAAIFAFAGNGFFTAIYYSTQRLCKARMFSDLLSWTHFWGWQLIIVAAAVTLPLGITSGKEYAELEWPIDIAIALVWVVFAINFFGTLAARRERHLYVALWFYIATIITVAVLHIFNSLAVPASALKGYSLYAGAQDAFMQWWYGHNAVAFFLTTPFLGLMYYFLPKAADRPVFSYRLSIVHFWSLVFIYIWAGPHHLHYLAIPEWLSTLGMLFSIMLWMPSWGGMINGLLTLRGAWHKVTEDPVLKFFVVGITFYGMSTFEGPLLAVKSVNALSHYTDWTIAHVHAGALGWNGFMTFGMIYWLLPRLYQTNLHSQKLANTHFWVSTLGLLLYIVPIYIAGLTQGLMWRAMDSGGNLMYQSFIETVQRLMPFYWARVLGGTLYITGAALCAYNVWATWQTRPARYAEVEARAPRLMRGYVDPPLEPAPLGHVANFARSIDSGLRAAWHRRWERLPLTFTVGVTLAVVAASLFEIIPTFLIRSNIPTIATVGPYTPLELEGRDVYIANGCYNCHSQMVRPIMAETKRFGEYSKAGEFVYDHPFQWGSRRIGPDLAREGGKQSSSWHLLHFQDPAQATPGSIMPRYPGLLASAVQFEGIEPKLRAMKALGVPYRDELGHGAELARAQAQRIALEIGVQIANNKGIQDEAERNRVAADYETRFKDKQVVALIAYLQRIGTDIFKQPLAASLPAATQPAAPATPAHASAAPVQEARP